MKKTFALILYLLLSASAFAQTAGKVLGFPQVAAGGGWKTVLNLSNRGTTLYSGSLSLSNMTLDGKPQPWSPIVNGTAITNGQLNIFINPGGTNTLTITGSGGTQAGFATITPVAPSDSELTSLVEGTLTYYITSGNTILDSIGIQPSDRIYQASVPFDNFPTIAFALANTHGASASVNLTVISASNQTVGTKALQLVGGGYFAGYLRDSFPNVQLTNGRLEIQSDVSILGTALTDSGGQFSSLPFSSAAKTYNWTLTFFPTIGASQTLTGTSVIRVFGKVLVVESQQLTQDGQPKVKTPTFASGTFDSGVLTFSVIDQASNLIQNYEISPFAFSMKTASGVGQLYAISPGAFGGTAAITITATN